MLCCWGEGRRRRVGADDAQGKVEAGRVGCVASALTGFSAASEVVRLPLRFVYIETSTPPLAQSFKNTNSTFAPRTAFLHI